MIKKIHSVSEKVYINNYKIKPQKQKMSVLKSTISPKRVLPVAAGTLLLSALGVGALIIKRIIDNTNPPRKKPNIM